jgi:3-oxoacyl-[acyl-carrier-protein] synthase-3
MLFPSTACLIQEKIQAKNAAAFDLSAACSGFIYGLSIANSFVASGVYKNVLVIGAEVLSAVLDPQDRRTVVLFGDGAGAAVVSEVEQESGFLAFDLGADGSGGHVLKVDAGGSKMPASEDTIASGSHYVKMMGKEVFKFAVKILGVTGKKVLEKAGISNEEVDFLIPHQANIRIVDAALRRFKISKEKTMINLEKYGNTSGASIPIALDEAVKQGRIKDGNVVVMVGFGAGLTWASTVMKYSFPGKGERKSA